VNVALALSAVVAVAIGLTIVRGLWPGSVDLRPYRFLVAALAVGVGLGITAVGLFCWLSLLGLPDRRLIAVELAMLSLLSLWHTRSRRRKVSAVPTMGPVRQTMHSTTARVVALAFAVTLGCAMAAFLGLSASRPHGSWDAWMNWNLRARLIFRSGPDWRVAFSPLLHWSHPDYPLLVQASVVRTWVYHGRETLAGPAMIAFLFAFATVGLATSAVASFRGRTQGMLAGLILLSTPFFVFHGISQYGDVPLGFFFLSTFVLMALYDRHGERTSAFAVLAGLTAGLAAWTKNEGVLFIAALVLSGVVTSKRGGSGRSLAKEAGAFALGLLPMLLIVGYFKAGFAPPNDLMSTIGSGETLARLTDPQRYLLVAKAYLSGVVRFGFNGLASAVPLLIAYGFCVGVRPGEATKRWFRLTVVTVALVLAGHAAVFIVTTEDVARLLNSSLERLLLQLWPAVVFAWFMLLADADEATVEPHRSPAEAVSPPSLRSG
jgi:Dolichyl-phosphate-mannose-protein mannosyltransferase